MSTISSPSNLSPRPPPAFLCTQTRALMREPVLALCGHLFDKQNIKKGHRCPVDQFIIESIIPCSELAGRIHDFVAPSGTGSQKSVFSAKQMEASKPIAWRGKANRFGSVSIGLDARTLGSRSVPLGSRALEPEPEAVVSGMFGAASDFPLLGEELAPQGPVSDTDSYQSFGRGSQSRDYVLPLRTCIENAHQDDIHGFVKASSNVFISGSKDNDLKMWDITTRRFKGLAVPSLVKAHTSYQYWITALSSFSGERWASGSRDGNITMWDAAGTELASVNYQPSAHTKDGYICKQRNKTRINCITELQTTETGTQFYTGNPGYVHLWGSGKQGIIQSYKACDNDWVYCVKVMDNHDLLVVIGCNLEYWKKDGSKFSKKQLIRETSEQHRVKQRPHISAITQLDGNDRNWAASLFDGSVKVVDVVGQRLVYSCREHRGRVWAVENLSPHIFASSADDRIIKLWDIRKKSSVHSFLGGPGRVSSLLRLNDNVFISGSCPDEVFKVTNKAEISFWDIRQLIRRIK